jgi:exodeoxyribonuclease VII small subunit
MTEERQSGEEGFETRMQRLEEIVQQLEEGDLTLERSLALFEEGVALARRLEDQLGKAEMKVEQLLQKSDGSEQTAAFDPDARESDPEAPL